MNWELPPNRAVRIILSGVVVLLVLGMFGVVGLLLNAASTAWGSDAVTAVCVGAGIFTMLTLFVYDMFLRE